MNNANRMFEWRKKNPERAKLHGRTVSARLYQKAYSDAHRFDRAAYRADPRNKERDRLLQKTPKRALWRKEYYARTVSERRAAERSWRLKNKFGITIKDYDIMFSSQLGACAVCGVEQPGKHLDVDHNHATGKVRGLLCGRCNKAIGLIKDSAVIVEKLHRYIKENDND